MTYRLTHFIITVFVEQPQDLLGLLEIQEGENDEEYEEEEEKNRFMTLLVSVS